MLFYGHMSVATIAYAMDQEHDLSDKQNMSEWWKQY